MFYTSYLSSLAIVFLIQPDRSGDPDRPDPAFFHFLLVSLLKSHFGLLGTNRIPIASPIGESICTKKFSGIKMPIRAGIRAGKIRTGSPEDICMISARPGRDSAIP